MRYDARIRHTCPATSHATFTTIGWTTQHNTYRLRYSRQDSPVQSADVPALLDQQVAELAKAKEGRVQHHRWAIAKRSRTVG